MKQWQSLLALVVVVLTLTSCRYKDLYYGELAEVNVQFDWSGIGHYEVGEMRVLFYPQDGEDHTPLMADMGAQGGIIHVPVGRYVVMTYNIDTERVLARGEKNLDLLELYTAQRSRNAYSRGISVLDSTDQDFVYAPDFVCSSRSNNIIVTNAGGTVTVRPVPSVYHITYTVHGLRGINHITRAGGLLSGISGSLFLADYRPADEPSIVEFGGSVNLEDSVVEGSFFIFDLMPNHAADLRQEFTLLIYSEGGNYYGTLDVTDRFQEVRATRTRTRNRSRADADDVEDINIDLHLDLYMDLNIAPDLDLPDSGFSPGLGTWEQHTTVVSF